MTNASIETLKRLVHESKYLVAVGGSGMQRESGHLSLRDQERAYSIEAEYGYSPEEMFSSAFYNTRTDSFYKFYKREVLAQIPEPGPAYYAMAKLMEEGILKCVISRNIYGLFQKVGCTNVLEPHGSIERNQCPHCKKMYPKEYLLNAKRTPLCENCMHTIRPGIRFYGEMTDNAVITKTAAEIAKADVFLVVGAKLDKDFCENNLTYYNGDKLVLITNTKKHFDEQADYVMYGTINEIVPQLV